MRSRNIKPDFLANETLCELSPLARLLFIGTWLTADRGGVFESRPKRIKHDILPWDDCDIESLLDQLVAQGFLLRFRNNEKDYFWVTRFRRHQNPHHQERFRFPLPKTSDCRNRDERESLAMLQTEWSNKGLDSDSDFHTIENLASQLEKTRRELEQSRQELDKSRYVTPTTGDTGSKDSNSLSGNDLESLSGLGRDDAPTLSQPYPAESFIPITESFTPITESAADEGHDELVEAFRMRQVEISASDEAESEGMSSMKEILEGNHGPK
jgi:hypothetical protein